MSVGFPFAGIPASNGLSYFLGLWPRRVIVLLCWQGGLFVTIIVKLGCRQLMKIARYVFFPRSVHFNIVMRDRININTDGITTGELHLLVLMKTKSFIGYKLQIKLLMHNLWCQLYK